MNIYVYILKNLTLIVFFLINWSKIRKVNFLGTKQNIVVRPGDTLKADKFMVIEGSHFEIVTGKSNSIECAK